MSIQFPSSGPQKEYRRKGAGGNEGAAKFQSDKYIPLKWGCQACRNLPSLQSAPFRSRPLYLAPKYRRRRELRHSSPTLHVQCRNDNGNFGRRMGGEVVYHRCPALSQQTHLQRYETGAKGAGGNSVRAICAGAASRWWLTSVRGLQSSLAAHTYSQ